MQNDQNRIKKNNKVFITHFNSQKKYTIVQQTSNSLKLPLNMAMYNIKKKLIKKNNIEFYR